ncbi:MAG: cupin domain-containing protein [Myxococcales bacterium]|nr:cupin domain-containing protein [Myxococcales bacterium]
MSGPNHADAVDLARAFATFDEAFAPRRVAHVDDMVVKIVRLRGEFVWHRHEDADELFIVHAGEMEIRYRDRTVRLGPGQLHVVPRGVEHKTFTPKECLALIVERRDTLNTGDAARGALTAHEEPFVGDA